MSRVVSKSFFYVSFLGELVQQSGKKMPYVKIGEIRKVFEDLPPSLLEEIGKVPRKSSSNGSGQRKKLWESQNLWKLGVSVATPSTSTSSALIPLL